ncbi:lytic murein transglycosylase B [Desulfopila aestuarii]|nr:lytic murein transglycosylase B [Desulfopila aestuarii]
MSLSACGGHAERTGNKVAHHTGDSQHSPLGAYSAQSISGDYAGYASLEQFIGEMVDKHGFERDYLNGLFSEAQRKNWTLNYLAKSDQAMKRGPSVGGWTRYRGKFLDKHHITGGVEFAYNYRSALQRASQEYGVPEEYILGILAVETIFGGNVGSHRVLDALTTLSFDYTRRGEYFRSELEDYLLMTRNEGLDPAEPIGSFAGAMGLGQFMPSSFLQFAVDFNNDGRRDLWDPEDAIGSIANYFAQHGWKPGQPVVSPLTARGKVKLEPGISKQYTLAEIEQAGLHSTHPYDTNGPLHLLLLRHAGHDQYLIGYPNFYTITRYNHSTYYAMAVHEVAQAIKQLL